MTVTGDLAAQLGEVERIKQLKARYFRLLDAKQWTEWSDTFTEDAELRYPARMGADPVVVRGRADIARGPRGRYGDDATTVHRGFTPEIELTSGDTAQGVWAMFDIIETRKETRMGFGHYHEEYAKVDDGQWRIRRCALIRQRLDVVGRSEHSGGLVLGYDGHRPQIDPTAWIASNATVVGRVTIASDCSVFYGAVLRAEVGEISVGPGTNLQDNVVVHCDTGHPARIGANATVGHAAVLHGCTIGDDVLIGMSSTVMNGCVIGAGSLVAAGSLVLEGTVVPPASLVAGAPATVRRTLTEADRDGFSGGAATYIEFGRTHAEAERV